MHMKWSWENWDKNDAETFLLHFGRIIWLLHYYNCFNFVFAIQQFDHKVQVQGLSQIFKRPGPGACSYICLSPPTTHHKTFLSRTMLKSLNTAYTYELITTHKSSETHGLG